MFAFSIRCWWLSMWSQRTWDCPQKLIFRLKKFTMWVLFHMSFCLFLVKGFPLKDGCSDCLIFWRLHIPWHIVAFYIWDFALTSEGLWLAAQICWNQRLNPSCNVSICNQSFHPPMPLEEKLCVAVWSKEFHSSSCPYDLDASYLFLSCPWPWRKS